MWHIQPKERVIHLNCLCRRSQRRKGDIYGFKIVNGKAYYAKWNDGYEGVDNFLNVECCDLGDLHKEQLIEEVSDLVFSGEFIFFSRLLGHNRHIYQYDITSQESKEILAFDIFGQNEESE